MTGGSDGGVNPNLMMGMGGMGFGGPMAGYYSSNNMAATLLAQSKCTNLTLLVAKFIDYYHYDFYFSRFHTLFTFFFVEVICTYWLLLYYYL